MGVVSRTLTCTKGRSFELEFQFISSCNNPTRPAFPCRTDCSIKIYSHHHDHMIISVIKLINIERNACINLRFLTNSWGTGKNSGGY